MHVVSLTSREPVSLLLPKFLWSNNRQYQTIKLVMGGGGWASVYSSTTHILCLIHSVRRQRQASRSQDPRSKGRTYIETISNSKKHNNISHLPLQPSHKYLLCVPVLSFPGTILLIPFDPVSPRASYSPFSPDPGPLLCPYPHIPYTKHPRI